MLKKVSFSRFESKFAATCLKVSCFLRQQLPKSLFCGAKELIVAPN